MRKSKAITPRKDTPIDLVTFDKEARERQLAAEDPNNQPFACPICDGNMILDSTFKQKNPFAGPGYYCCNVQCNEFGRMVDISYTKLPYAHKTQPVDVGDPNVSPIEFIDESRPKGLDFGIDDEYEKYDPEPGEDERIKMQGGHIIRSEITLRQGNNRTVVKRT